MSEEMKTCKCCGDVKALELFPLKGGGRRGADCNICRQEKRRFNYDSDRQRAYNQKWQLSHPEDYKAAKKRGDAKYKAKTKAKPRKPSKWRPNKQRRSMYQKSYLQRKRQKEGYVVRIKETLLPQEIAARRLESHKRWRLKDPDKAKARGRRGVADIADWYVALQLSVPVSLLKKYPALLESQREVIRLKRQFSKEKTTLTKKR